MIKIYLYVHFVSCNISRLRGGGCEEITPLFQRKWLSSSRSSPLHPRGRLARSIIWRSSGLWPHMNHHPTNMQFSVAHHHFLPIIPACSLLQLVKAWWRSSKTSLMENLIRAMGYPWLSAQPFANSEAFGSLYLYAMIRRKAWRQEILRNLGPWRIFRGRFHSKIFEGNADLGASGPFSLPEAKASKPWLKNETPPWPWSLLK